MAESSSEESLASLCREAEQLKVKIDEEKQKVCDLQRKFQAIVRKVQWIVVPGKISWNGTNASETLRALDGKPRGSHPVLANLLIPKIFEAKVLICKWLDFPLGCVEIILPSPVWNVKLTTRAVTCQLQGCQPRFKYWELGCLPFSQKIRKFRFEVKWKGNFPENLFGNCGQPPEVVHFFRSERKSGNSLTICENRSVSRPFFVIFCAVLHVFWIWRV